jgi:hypothetical protein
MRGMFQKEGSTLAAIACLSSAAWCAAAQPPHSAADAEKGAWLKVSTANFELYTTAGEDAGRSLISRFEHLRTVVQPVIAGKVSRRKPVCIIAFRSHDEFQAYAPISRSTGFFLPGPRRDFIVLDGPSTETHTAAHEYGHLVMAQSGLRLPAWLNEGLAELYSNVEGAQSEPHMIVGRFIPCRVLSLRRDSWIGLTELVSASAHSPVFTGAASVDSAYAQSWLLAHMLVLDPRYAGHFQGLLLALQSAGTADAFGMVYGKSVAQVEWDLTGYLEAGQANARALDSPLPPTAQPIGVEREADFDARLALAEMLGNYLGRGEQAREEYRQLACDYPLRPEARTGIGENLPR